jgi:hypothetical protein
MIQRLWLAHMASLSRLLLHPTPLAAPVVPVEEERRAEGRAARASVRRR